VQASRSSITNKVLWTLEIEYPRFILAELAQHCMLEKNSSSSRAIPIKTQQALIETNPAIPVHWGKNQAGMQAETELDELQQEGAKGVWLAAMQTALAHSTVLADIGLHKQITNRITEPWQRMKTVISGTEWANFFNLRLHPAAQPEIYELARAMQAAMLAVEPDVVHPDEWHVPYVERRLSEGTYKYFSAGKQLTAQQARIVSASCCAQTSFRKSDQSLEKAEDVFKKLNIGSSTEPAHASPCTHQATPIDYQTIAEQELEFHQVKGISHLTFDGERYRLWSGKFQDFIQYRKLIPNEAVW
jgi:hypothetical protein